MTSQNANIVTDLFHVFKLINHHFSKNCKMIDEKKLFEDMID